MVKVDPIKEFVSASYGPVNGTYGYRVAVRGDAPKCLAHIAANEGFTLLHIHESGNFHRGLKCERA